MIGDCVHEDDLSYITLGSTPRESPAVSVVFRSLMLLPAKDPGIVAGS
jgi:hypothetical protein